jgi:hypothetical protein
MVFDLDQFKPITLFIKYVLHARRPTLLKGQLKLFLGVKLVILEARLRQLNSSTSERRPCKLFIFRLKNIDMTRLFTPV